MESPDRHQMDSEPYDHTHTVHLRPSAGRPLRRRDAHASFRQLAQNYNCSTGMLRQTLSSMNSPTAPLPKRLSDAASCLDIHRRRAVNLSGCELAQVVLCNSLNGINRPVTRLYVTEWALARTDTESR
eukprot:6183248-Pleurochrysis_carterae.AAC.1